MSSSYSLCRDSSIDIELMVICVLLLDVLLALLLRDMGDPGGVTVPGLDRDALVVVVVVAKVLIDRDSD